jgi:hypothetical protein
MDTDMDTDRDTDRDMDREVEWAGPGQGNEEMTIPLLSHKKSANYCIMVFRGN